MNRRERLLTALDGGKPDRLPATTHHVMPYFLEKYMGNISIPDFFDKMDLDPIHWTLQVTADESRGEYVDPGQEEPGFLQIQRVFSDSWKIETTPVEGTAYQTRRETIHTPRGDLTMVVQGNVYTEWVAEFLVKEKSDLDLIASHQTWPVCDVEAVNREAEQWGEWGIIRGFIIPFDVYGQPGCWQDFCCIRGTQQAIMDTFDDPAWVHQMLTVIMERKLHYIRSMKGARYDLMELGGGDASTTVISPALFDEFVAPYDAKLIEEAHDAGIRIVYHTCGGMMPILENIAAMKPDAMETFTPLSMGADVDLAKAKARIGDKVCMIGGFDQGHYFQGCSPAETRAYVRKCFEEAGEGGGYIIAPSDHFFDADPELVRAFAEEAKRCVY
jgi:uroporphyrinogen decarboxylase